MQFIGSLDLLRIWIAASIWLSFLPAGFDSLAVGFATVAFFLVGLVVVALVAFAFGFLATVLVVLAIVLVVISASPMGMGLVSVLRHAQEAMRLGRDQAMLARIF